MDGADPADNGNPIRHRILDSVEQRACLGEQMIGDRDVDHRRLFTGTLKKDINCFRAILCSLTSRSKKKFDLKIGNFASYPATKRTK